VRGTFTLDPLRLCSWVLGGEGEAGSPGIFQLDMPLTPVRAFHILYIVEASLDFSRYALESAAFCEF